MPSLTELDVVNSMLAGMGIAPRTSLTRPDRYTATGIQKLKRWSRQIQARGWWFNDMAVDLIPAVVEDEPEDLEGGTGHYRVDSQLPCNIILLEGPAGQPVSLKKPGWLYDLRTAKEVKSPITVRVIYELPFVELPDNAQFYISDCAVADFAGHLAGDKLDVDRALQTASLLQLNAENTRQRQVNLFRNPSVAAKLQRIRGHRA